MRGPVLLVLLPVPLVLLPVLLVLLVPRQFSCCQFSASSVPVQASSGQFRPRPRGRQRTHCDLHHAWNPKVHSHRTHPPARKERQCGWE